MHISNNPQVSTVLMTNSWSLLREQQRVGDMPGTTVMRAIILGMNERASRKLEA